MWLLAMAKVVGAFFKKVAGFVLDLAKAFLSWFGGLSAYGKVLFFLVLSLVLNAYQFYSHIQLKEDLRLEKKACKEQREKEEQKGAEIHTGRQTMLDFLMDAAKLESDKKVVYIEKKVEVEKVRYEQIKAAAPLPRDCKFGPDRVQAANEAIRGLTAGAVRPQ